MTATSIGMRSHRTPVVHKTGYLIATYSHGERSKWDEIPRVDPDFDEMVISERAADLIAKITRNAALARQS